jgi:hypothetical protein
MTFPFILLLNSFPRLILLDIGPKTSRAIKRDMLILYLIKTRFAKKRAFIGHGLISLASNCISAETAPAAHTAAPKPASALVITSRHWRCDRGLYYRRLQVSSPVVANRLGEEQLTHAFHRLAS